MTFEQRGFDVVIERDEDGLYVGEVPQLTACYSQGETIDELMANIKLCVEAGDIESLSEFSGI